MSISKIEWGAFASIVAGAVWIGTLQGTVNSLDRNEIQTAKEKAIHEITEAKRGMNGQLPIDESSMNQQLAVLIPLIIENKEFNNAITNKWSIDKKVETPSSSEIIKLLKNDNEFMAMAEGAPGKDGANGIQGPRGKKGDQGNPGKSISRKELENLISMKVQEVLLPKSNANSKNQLVAMSKKLQSIKVFVGSTEIILNGNLYITVKEISQGSCYFRVSTPTREGELRKYELGSRFPIETPELSGLVLLITSIRHASYCEFKFI